MIKDKIYIIFLFVTGMAIKPSVFCEAQTASVTLAARDSLVRDLKLDIATADSLVANIFLLERQKSELKLDTTISFQVKHERTLQLNLSRESMLKKWLTDEKYNQWRELYRRRLDPVVLLYRKVEQ